MISAKAGLHLQASGCSLERRCTVRTESLAAAESDTDSVVFAERCMLQNETPD